MLVTSPGPNFSDFPGEPTCYVDCTRVIDSLFYPSPLSSILHLSHLLGAKLTGRAKLVLAGPRLLWWTGEVATSVPYDSAASSPGSGTEPLASPLLFCG